MAAGGSHTISIVTAPVVVILAAGQGTRMRSATPKLLHPLCGRPMIAWPLAAAREAGAAKVVLVDSPARSLAPALDALDGAGEVVVAVQEQPLGTADAVRAASAHIDGDAPVIVLNGDGPLITAELIRALADAHEREGAGATITTVELEDPTGYGRVVRAPDGTVERVVETKNPGDASALELRIREINIGFYAFAGDTLLEALAQVASDNAQGEQYLPDVIPIMREHEHSVLAFEVDDPEITLGVNDRIDLAAVTRIAQRRIAEQHMLAGVTIVDPGSTVIDVAVTIAEDTVIAPFTSLHGATSIGRGSTIGPLSTLIDVRVGDGAKVVHAYALEAEVGDRVSVGPFAYLRPGTLLRPGSKAGTFVEIKNSDVGEGTKIPHLSYIGDADIGEGTNLGAATITANYDGYRKHRTTIGSRVKTSVDTTLVAPVTIGDHAYTAAGSVITKDVPPGALGVARARQENKDGYAQRRAEQQAAAQNEQASTRNEQASAQNDPATSGKDLTAEPAE
jgi:bifunctional UDP-N-acetylglucosamine pyrophosphorylase/glucosamine-1-phosphate N-acetyltransferase